MGVTRLERKGRKNKTVAKTRVKTIKRLRSKINILSPNKEESGVVIGSVSDVMSNMKSSPAKAAKPAKPAKEKKAEEKVEAKSATSAEAKPDKLTKIEGVGPKIAEVLSNAGLSTFAAVAASNAESIREILDAAEGNFKAHDPSTWSDQAQMAADGKWDELKKWQDELDGGKPA